LKTVLLSIDKVRKNVYNIYMREKTPDSKEDKHIPCNMCGKDTKVSSTAVDVICARCVVDIQEEMNYEGKNIFEDKLPSVLGQVT